MKLVLHIFCKWISSPQRKKNFAPKRKQIISFKSRPISELIWCAEKQTGSYKVVSLIQSGEKSTNRIKLIPDPDGLTTIHHIYKLRLCSTAAMKFIAHRLVHLPPRSHWTCNHCMLIRWGNLKQNFRYK